MNITANTEGKNNITSTYSGSTNYTKSTNKTTFTAKKINTKITLGSTKTVKLGKQMSIYGNQDLQKISGYIWLMKYAPINIR